MEAKLQIEYSKAGQPKVFFLYKSMLNVKIKSDACEIKILSWKDK